MGEKAQVMTPADGDREMFRPLVESLLNFDPFLVLADYADYLQCQERVSAAWRDQAHWTRMSILNTARAGKFSSDRSIRVIVRPTPSLTISIPTDSVYR